MNIPTKPTRRQYQSAQTLGHSPLRTTASVYGSGIPRQTDWYSQRDGKISSVMRRTKSVNISTDGPLSSIRRIVQQPWLIFSDPFRARFRYLRVNTAYDARTDRTNGYTNEGRSFRGGRTASISASLVFRRILPSVSIWNGG